MFNSINVKFYVLKSKQSRSGFAPLTLTIIVNGERARVILPRKLNPKDFNAKKQLATDPEINNFISVVRTKIMQIHTQLIATDEVITAELIKAKFLNKQPSKDWKLLELYQEHINELEKGIGKTIVKATHLKHTKVRQYVSDFLKFKYGAKDISINKITQGMLWDLYNYLLIERKLKQNTVVGYLTKLKKIIRIAINHKYITENPFQGMTLRLEKVDPSFLTRKELDLIINKDFSHNKRLEQIRDVAVFNSFTGLAYIDSKTLSKEHITQDEQGNYWIRKPRQKTGVLARIPLLPIPLAILKKYDWKLPVPSCQKMNAYLHEIGEICGIDKHLSSHTFRHTAATQFLTAGISLESTSKLLGHSNLKMTMHYARLLDERILREIQVMK